MRELILACCTAGVVAIGMYVCRPGGPDPYDPAEATAARAEYARAVLGVALLAALASVTYAMGLWGAQ